MSRILRRLLALVLLIAGVAATVVAKVGVGGLDAAALASGQSPLVYVSGGTTSGTGTAELDGFTLAGITSHEGGSLPAAQANHLSGFGQAASVVVTRDSDKAVEAIDSPSGAGAIGIVVIDTANGHQLGSVAPSGGVDKFGNLVALAADPANAAVVYGLTRFGYVFTFNIDSFTYAKFWLETANGPFFLSNSRSMAVSNDGTTAYIGAMGSVSAGTPTAAIYKVNLASSTFSIPWTTPEGSASDPGIVSVALGPGNQVLAASDTFQILVFNLPGFGVKDDVTSPLVFNTEAVTIGPGGANVFGIGYGGNLDVWAAAFPVGAPSRLNVVTLAPNGFAHPLSLTAYPNAGFQLAVTTDGGTLLSTATVDAGQTLYDISLGGNTAAGAPAMHVHPSETLPPSTLYPVGLAIAPDQAPVASVTGASGGPQYSVNFDAGSSTVKYGSIARYAWLFGDGQSATTTGPTESHTYGGPGTYTITLTEASSAGTTIPPAFPGTSVVSAGAGQTPYRLSSNSARTTLTVTVSSTGVTTSTTTSTLTTTTTTPPPPPPHFGPNPVLTLTPAVGPPGSVVQVTGKNFPVNAIVTIEWSTPNASSTAVKVKAVHGKFTTTLLILVPDLLGKREALAKGYAKANKPSYLVVASSEEPGGADANPVFRSEGP